MARADRCHPVAPRLGLTLGRAHLRRRGIQANIARRGIERDDRLVERTHAWLAAFGKLRTHFERRINIHVALLSLACCVICVRKLEPFCQALLVKLFCGWNGLRTVAPVPVKSATLRVTTVNPHASAVAAISASRSGRRFGACRRAQ